MAERPAFQARQFAFAAHIRDPDTAPLPAGIDDRRMAVYRELFFNNLRNLLATMFPVCRRIVGTEGWAALIREFLRTHRASTPYFLRLPQEFLAFLENEHPPGNDHPPYLAELAHYEYAELEVSIDVATEDPAAVLADGDLLAGVPVPAAALRCYAYRWPVHRITTGAADREPLAAPVHLAVFRRRDDSVGFVELNPVSAALLERIMNNAAGVRGETLLRQLAADTGYAEPAAFVTHGRVALEEMRMAGLLLGVRVTGSKNA